MKILLSNAFSFLQISAEHIQIRHENPVFLRQNIFRVKLLIEKALSPSVHCTLPEQIKNFKGKVIKLIPVGEINEKKSHALLLLKLLHEVNLMLMDILKGKTVYGAFLGIKTDRNPLNHPDIVHSTLLLKVGEGDMP